MRPFRRLRLKDPSRRGPRAVATRLTAATVAAVTMATVSLVLLVGATRPDAGASPPVASQSAAQAALSAVRFEAFDVVVDSGGEPLHAYQVRLKASTGSHARVRLVGVEGGEPAGQGAKPVGPDAEPARGAFVAPPYYDPAALQQDVVILGGLAAAGLEAPRGATRVARVHVIVEPVGGASAAEATTPVAWEAEVMTAGRADATRIEAKVSVTRVQH